LYASINLFCKSGKDYILKKGLNVKNKIIKITVQINRQKEEFRQKGGPVNPWE
jgi:hypothetical protein